MPGHDIIAIGASAGGLKALRGIVAGLPAGLEAAIFVVQHVAPNAATLLPRALERSGPLESALAADGEPVRPGRIYVAAPDHHLIVNRGVLRLSRGPHENRFRPSIDVLFRSVARAYGPRVIGVVLTGYLDDGTVGLRAIKQRGGISVVQDPLDAEYPGMPRSALRYVHVDHCVPADAMAGLLARLVASPAPDEAAYPVGERLEIEANIAEQQMDTLEFLKNVERIGSRTTYTCPQCSGAIWQIGKDEEDNKGQEQEPLRFRCHVGHSFTAEVFLDEQTQHVENALWSAVRMMEEKVTFWRQYAARLERHGAHESAARHEEYARKLDGEVGLIRDLILQGSATRRSVAGEERDASHQVA
jgi:two-component system chemotaxis response regulator CheB